MGVIKVKVWGEQVEQLYGIIKVTVWVVYAGLLYGGNTVYCMG
jgi:hypothetical protein